MLEAIKEMGPVGKIVLALMIASSAKSCVRHIGKTIELRKAAK